MRSAALFAMFGLIAAIVTALGRDEALEETLRSAFGWALGFGFLGWGIGRAARMIAHEALPEGKPADLADNREEGAWNRPAAAAGAETPPPATSATRESTADSSAV